MLDEDLDRPTWQAEYFVGVPAPAGAVLVLLPVYLVFIGVYEPDRIGLRGSAFTVLVAFLLVSRLPVYSGKKLRIRRDRVLPLILAVVFVLLLLLNYPWQTLGGDHRLSAVPAALGARLFAERAR